MRDLRDTCEGCQAWAKAVGYDGKEMLVPMLDDSGKPLTKDGSVQYEKAEDGRFVMSGNCRLRAPGVVQMPNGSFSTVFPSTKSNWWCEDPDRRALVRGNGKHK